jgi:uncharacterized protein (TIGR01777 family)
MRYVIAGSSGFLGTALREACARDGHEVVRLVRGDSPSPSDSRWDPASGQVDLDVIASADVVVNVAGAPLARPWTSSQREAIRRSRVDTTSTLARAIADVGGGPAFLAQSGIAAYGSDRGDKVLEESTPAEGGGFLHGVVREWEAAAAPAETAGARVCHLRTGVVIDRKGGPLPLMLPAFRLGLGGPIGSGDQYFSVISLTDWVGAVRFLGAGGVQGDGGPSGDFNLTAPLPPTNEEFTKALGAKLHRPTKLRVPAFVLRKTLGELSGEILGSLRVVPAALESAGYRFQHRSVDAVLDSALS